MYPWLKGCEGVQGKNNGTQPPIGQPTCRPVLQHVPEGVPLRRTAPHCTAFVEKHASVLPTPCVTFRRVAVSLRDPWAVTEWQTAISACKPLLQQEPKGKKAVSPSAGAATSTCAGVPSNAFE